MIFCSVICSLALFFTYSFNFGSFAGEIGTYYLLFDKPMQFNDVSNALNSANLTAKTAEVRLMLDPDGVITSGFFGALLKTVVDGESINSAQDANQAIVSFEFGSHIGEQIEILDGRYYTVVGIINSKFVEVNIHSLKETDLIYSVLINLKGIRSASKSKQIASTLHSLFGTLPEHSDYDTTAFLNQTSLLSGIYLIIALSVLSYTLGLSYLLKESNLIVKPLQIIGMSIFRIALLVLILMFLFILFSFIISIALFAVFVVLFSNILPFTVVFLSLVDLMYLLSIIIAISMFIVIISMFSKFLRRS
jgi:hypothetical protein